MERRMMQGFEESSSQTRKEPDIWNKGESESNTDINYVTNTEAFRLRACAIIIENGAVLMAGNNHDDYFYSVGGAVKMGETIEEACLREVFEETGVKFEIERLVFIHENFFDVGARRMHELAFYFLMKPQVHGEFMGEVLGNRVERVTWIPIKDFSSYSAYPTFFAEKLGNIPEYPEGIVSYE
ncbi:MAG: NUDIX domain-containing protein [Streptococcaceae bacterium]|jgi:ADP-ribose pyrophosphatase YjhB (NUDIX family)|nr:NUDIX domain-containing protein [Streptococcaceae bacterium]